MDAPQSAALVRTVPPYNRRSDRSLMPDEPRIEYVEARRVLLDALAALEPHLQAIVLIGAQAVYLRTANRLPTYQPFTTDADLVVDPSSLEPAPSLGELMRSAGFSLTSEPGAWEAHVSRAGTADEIFIPLDLIVPEQLAAKAGRRAARLPGDHGKTTARKALGVEGAVVDHDRIMIDALEPGDDRRFTVNVAGVGALFVAKAHKLGERLAKPARLESKDAGDVYRLFDAQSPEELSASLRRLLTDPRSGGTTEMALEYARQLFLTPGSVGVGLAVTALRGVLAEATVATVMTTYTRALLDQLQGEDADS
jgi:hypothetical protein